MNSYKIIDTGISNPDICIAMLAYNHGEFISEAIESVLKQQTSYSYKIIIAEDYSTDNTRNIILEYQAKYADRIKVILQEVNVGAQKNNIVLLSNLEGKYVAALEGDDYWTDPFKLQKQVDFLEANEHLVGCFSDAIAIDIEGNKLRDALLPEHKKQVSIAGIGDFWIPTLTVCFKREYLRDLLQAKRFSEVYNGDMLLYYTISQYGDFGYVQTEPSCYREHAGGVWSTVKIIERYRRNLISNFIIYDILLAKNKQHMLRRIEVNIQWQLEHYRTHEHISKIPSFLKKNLKQLAQRSLYPEAARLLARSLLVLAERTKQKIARA